MSLISTIEGYFEDRQNLSVINCPEELSTALTQVLDELDSGIIRAASIVNNQWVVNAWVKKAILLCFKVYPNVLGNNNDCQYYDKVPLKFAGKDQQFYLDNSIRVVPNAIARRGSFIGKNTILMPSYVNIGAYIDEEVMVDTWATVGSCAQIGKRVHISGGAGIGGVLEPLQSSPTIIEDDCFIGARSEIVEGVIVERGSVISMGVYIGQSTKIYNRITGETLYGRVPRGSVVVPGSLPDKNGVCNLYCAVIIKQVDENTRKKTAINDLLRDS